MALPGSNTRYHGGEPPVYLQQWNATRWAVYEWREYTPNRKNLATRKGQNSLPKSRQFWTSGPVGRLTAEPLRRLRRRSVNFATWRQIAEEHTKSPGSSSPPSPQRSPKIQERARCKSASVASVIFVVYVSLGAGVHSAAAQFAENRALRGYCGDVLGGADTALPWRRYSEGDIW